MSLGCTVNAKLTVTDKLTVTAGLRWDAQWNPQPPNPNPAIPLTTSIPSDLNQWQPRLGIAWGATSKTVLRASAGLYDAPTPATYFQRVFTDNGLNTTVADSYYDPQLLQLFANSLPLTYPRRARGADHASRVRRRHRPELPQSAFLPGLRQR